MFATGFSLLAADSTLSLPPPTGRDRSRNWRLSPSPTEAAARCWRSPSVPISILNNRRPPTASSAPATTSANSSCETPLPGGVSSASHSISESSMAFSSSCASMRTSSIRCAPRLSFNLTPARGRIVASGFLKRNECRPWAGRRPGLPGRAPTAIEGLSTTARMAAMQHGNRKSRTSNQQNCQSEANNATMTEHPERRRSRAPGWCRRMAAFSFVLLATVWIGHHFGLVETMAYLWVLALVAALVAISLIVAAFAFSRIWTYGGPGGRDVAFGVMVALIVLAPYGYAAYLMLVLPPLRDISTDLDAPPT